MPRTRQKRRQKQHSQTDPEPGQKLPRARSRALAGKPREGSRTQEAVRRKARAGSRAQEAARTAAQEAERRKSCAGSRAQRHTAHPGSADAR